MKVQNITDIDKFFKVVDDCKGKVELVTGEGDRLNLKSKLSQYVSMANIFSDGVIKELEIVAYEPVVFEGGFLKRSHCRNRGGNSRLNPFELAFYFPLIREVPLFDAFYVLVRHILPLKQIIVTSRPRIRACVSLLRNNVPQCKSIGRSATYT